VAPEPDASHLASESVPSCQGATAPAPSSISANRKHEVSTSPQARATDAYLAGRLPTPEYLDRATPEARTISTDRSENRCLKRHGDHPLQEADNRRVRVVD